jgi:uracil-DNA glycosylase family 4
MMEAELKAEAEHIRPLKTDPDCQRCELSKTSVTVCCPAIGPKQASILVFGEALGVNGEELGKPFVGDTGYKLNWLLKKAKLRRKEIRIRNVINCRPPKNRKPKKKELDACWPYVLREILTVKPKVIVALGATAINQLFVDPLYKVDGTKNTGQIDVYDWRGFPKQQTFEYETKKGKTITHTCWVVPTYHPAACLHNWELDDLVVFDLKLASEYASGNVVLQDPKTKVYFADTYKKARALLRTLKRLSSFVLDYETTGFDPHKAKILCAGFCWKAGYASVLPLRGQGGKHFWPKKQQRIIEHEFKEVLRTANLIGQNLKFDNKFSRKLTGIVDYHVIFDTLIAHHNVNETLPHNLTFLCQWYLHWTKYDQVMKQYLSEDGYRDAPNKPLWKYCGYDVDGTFQVRKKLIQELKQEKVIRPFNIHIGLINAITDMEYRGVSIDTKRLLKLSAYYRKNRDQSWKRLKRIAIRYLGEEVGLEFNPRSPQQLGKLIIETGTILKKTTQAGNLSVDKYVLAALALKPNTTAGRIAKHVIDIRKAGKNVSTYLDGEDGKGAFLQWVTGNERLHPNVNIGKVRTGRLSIIDPPIQTVPRTGCLRTIIVPDTMDSIFISVDYEKIELCIMAWLANDRIMVRELIEGMDLHTRMALTVRLGRDPTDQEFRDLFDTVGKADRSIAKGVNFGVPYGRSADAIAEANPEVFPMNLNRTQRKAKVQGWMDAYFAKYEGVTEYREEQIYLAHKNGRIRSKIFNRVRRLHGIRWYNSPQGLATSKHDMDLGHLEREALNCQIQSIAGDILATATVVCYKGIQQVKLPGFRIVMSVHDELIFNIKKQYAQDAIQLITKWMASELPKGNGRKYTVPLKVDAEEQRSYGEEYLSIKDKQKWLGDKRRIRSVMQAAYVRRLRKPV